MPLRPYSRGLSRFRREPVKGAVEKMGLPWDAYYVLTKAEARLTNSKIHPNDGAPNYDITHNVSDLVADADLDLGAYDFITTGKFSDATNEVTAANMKTAFDHSQIAGGDSVHVLEAENTAWDSAYAHVTADGSDHSFIDQSVVTTASPTFARVNFVSTSNHIRMSGNDLYIGAATKLYLDAADFYLEVADHAVTYDGTDFSIDANLVINPIAYYSDIRTGSANGVMRFTSDRTTSTADAWRWINADLTTRMALSDGGNLTVEGYIISGSRLQAPYLLIQGTTTPIADFVDTGASAASGGAGMVGYSKDGAAQASGDRLAYFGMGGLYDATHLFNAVMIQGFATELWGAAARGAKMNFSTTENGTVTRAVRLTIDHDGEVGIGTETPGATLDVNGDAIIQSDLTVTGDFKANQPFVHVRKNQTQALTTATNTAILFDASDTEESDDLGFHDPATNNTRFTVPAGYGGIYVVAANVTWAQNATGQRGCFIKKNAAATGVDAFIDYEWHDASAASLTTFDVTAILELAAGDYVEFFAFQNSGGNLNITSIAEDDQYPTEFRMTRISAGATA